MGHPSARPAEQTVTVPWRFDSLGAALRELRESRGRPLRDVAPELSVSYAELSRIERGQRPVTEVVAQAAERFFSAELQARDAVGSLIAAAALSRPVRRSSRSSLPRALAEPLPAGLLLGREREHAHLVANLRAGGISTIDGLPGTGATALLAAAVRDLGSKYRPGRVLSADVGDDPDPAIAYQVLGRWLSDLGVAAEDVPARLEERGAALDRALHGPPGLLIVENAVAATQLRPLLALASNRGYDLVVTSHRRLPEMTLSAGARPLTLRPLAAEDGARLLRALDKDGRLDTVPDGSLATISRLCGGIPAALHTVSAHLRRYDRLSVHDLHETLADPTQRLDVLSDVDDERNGLRARLTRTYTALPADARWLFRTLALHGGQTVTLRGAAALAGQAIDTVLPGLQQLTDAHVLEPTQPERWVWHTLPLLFANELVHRFDDPYQRVHATRRWVHWLIQVATAAAETATTAEHHTSHIILDAETHNFAAATTVATYHGQTGLIRQLISLLDQAGRPDLAERCKRVDTTAGTAPRWPPTGPSATTP